MRRRMNGERWPVAVTALVTVGVLGLSGCATPGDARALGRPGVTPTSSTGQVLYIADTKHVASTTPTSQPYDLKLVSRAAKVVTVENLFFDGRGRLHAVVAKSSVKPRYRNLAAAVKALRSIGVIPERRSRGYRELDELRNRAVAVAGSQLSAAGVRIDSGTVEIMIHPRNRGTALVKRLTRMGVKVTFGVVVPVLTAGSGT